MACMIEKLYVFPDYINMINSTTNLTFKKILLPIQLHVESNAQKKLDKFETTTIRAHPGFGKTIISSSLLVQSKLLTLVLVYTNMSAIQWKESL